MVAARLIEPISKAAPPQSPCPRSAGRDRSTATPCRSVWGAALSGDTRGASPQAAVRSRHRHQGTGAVPAGVTTLCFETEKEDSLRRVDDWQSAPGRSPGHRGPAGRPGRVPSPSRVLSRATGPRPPRSSPWWRPSRPLAASPSSPVVAGRRHALGGQSGGVG